MTTQNLWDTAKKVLRGKFIAIQSYLKKQEKHRIDNLTLHLKQLEKEDGKKISRRKEIIKIRAEINEKEMKETIVKINKTKSWFFEKESDMTEVTQHSTWRTVWRFLKKLKIELPYDPTIPPLGIYSEKTIIQEDMYTPIFIPALFTIFRMWKEPKCPLTGEWIKQMWYVEVSGSR